MTKLVWRLGKLPSPDEVRELVKDKIITQEEARNILFNSETEEDRDKESLKSEIKFLRDLIDKLAARSEIVEKIRYIEKPYYSYPWYTAYQTYCSPRLLVNGTATLGNSNLSLQTSQANIPSNSFNAINTF